MFYFESLLGNGIERVELECLPCDERILIDANAVLVATDANKEPSTEELTAVA